MKKQLFALISLIALICLIPQSSDAQLLNKLNKKIENKAEQKIEEKIDKTVSGKPAENTNTNTNSTPNSNGSEATGSINSISKAPTKADYKSKFDFIPGEKVLYFYDFSEEQVGDAPTGWQVDGSAEIVNMDQFPGNFLMVSPQSGITPMTTETYPENFTIQFDLICTNPFTWGSSSLYFALGGSDRSIDVSTKQNHLGSSENSVFKLTIHPGSQTAASAKGYGNYSMVSSVGSKDGTFTADAWLDVDESRLLKVSIWRQNRRIRVYLNENKILDMPTILPEKAGLNTMAWNANSYYGDDRYFISNIRFATGLPDTRKKIVEEGRFVTSGILFDVNSDLIKPESYGVLKDVANMLKENSSMKVTIIGHTDSDGDAEKNLNLSQKRAAAVKNALNSDFGIDPSRMQTDGKGESEPIVENNSPQNKANNRRVEFVTLNEH